MTALLYLIPISLVLGTLALAAFVWTVRSRQYEDLEAEKYRILDDDPISTANPQIVVTADVKKARPVRLAALSVAARGARPR